MLHKENIYGTVRVMKFSTLNYFWVRDEQETNQFSLLFIKTNAFFHSFVKLFDVWLIFEAFFDMIRNH